MPRYTAYFETDADFAERVIDADTPGEALQMARALDMDDLYFRPHDADAPLNEIRIVRDADLATVAEWKDPDFLAREAGPELLEALQKAEHYLSRFYALAIESETDPRYGLERDAITEARAAIASATGEPTPEPASIETALAAGVDAGPELAELDDHEERDWAEYDHGAHAPQNAAAMEKTPTPEPDDGPDMG